MRVGLLAQSCHRWLDAVRSRRKSTATCNVYASRTVANVAH